MAFFMDETKVSDALTHSWLCYSLSRGIKLQQRRDIQQLVNSPVALGAMLLRITHPELSSTEAISIDSDTLEQLSPFLKRHLLSAESQRRANEAMLWQSAVSNRHIISIGQSDYPMALADIADAPSVLYVSGKAEALAGPNIAIVGSRKASTGGLQQARDVSADLARAGVGTVSGLARGIDAAAHQGSLTGGGLTIAVSATAPDKIYPAGHRQLAEQIMENGAVVTEFPLGSILRPGCFPRRNRIISGLSMAVLVVEAAVPSGTLTTAQHALNQGRDVLAMPGSVKNPLVTGCHTLIKQGGILATGADDILAALAYKLEPLLSSGFRPTVRKPDLVESTDSPETSKAPAGSQEERSFLDQVGYNPADIDELVARCEFSASKVSSLLLRLELKGLVTKDSGGRYVRC